MEKLTLLLVPPDTDRPIAASQRMLDPFVAWDEPVPCGCNPEFDCWMCHGTRQIANLYQRFWTIDLVSLSYKQPPPGALLAEPETHEEMLTYLTEAQIARMSLVSEILDSSFPDGFCRVGDIPNEFMCNAVVTPDGRWHDITGGEVYDVPTLEVTSRLKVLLEQHPECIGVLWDLD